MKTTETTVTEMIPFPELFNRAIGRYCIVEDYRTESVTDGRNRISAWVVKRYRPFLGIIAPITIGYAMFYSGTITAVVHFIIQDTEFDAFIAQCGSFLEWYEREIETEITLEKRKTIRGPVLPDETP